MSDDQTNSGILEAFGKVEHPSIAATLLDLGILRNPEVTPEGKVSLTLALPFPNIPDAIRDYMVNSLAKAAQSAGGELTKVSVTSMTQDEIQSFLVKEQQNW